MLGCQVQLSRLALGLISETRFYDIVTLRKVATFSIMIMHKPRSGRCSNTSRTLSAGDISAVTSLIFWCLLGWIGSGVEAFGFSMSAPRRGSTLAPLSRDCSGSSSTAHACDRFSVGWSVPPGRSLRARCARSILPQLKSSEEDEIEVGYRAAMHRGLLISFRESNGVFPNLKLLVSAGTKFTQQICENREF